MGRCWSSLSQNSLWERLPFIYWPWRLAMGWGWRTHPDQKLLNEFIWPGSWVSHQDVIFEQRQGILCAALPEQAGGSQPPGQTCAMGKREIMEMMALVKGEQRQDSEAARTWYQVMDSWLWVIHVLPQHQLWAAASHLDELWKLSPSVVWKRGENEVLGNPWLQICVITPFNRISFFMLHHRGPKLVWTTPGMA